MSTIEGAKLPTCNLYLMGRGRDRNGNSTVKLGFWTGRNFSIQTNAGSLRNTYSILRGLTPKEISRLPNAKLNTISKEVANHIKKYGTANQKKKRW